MKNEEEIQEMADKARDARANPLDMTYEEGVEAALLWVIGKSEEPID